MTAHSGVAVLLALGVACAGRESEPRAGASRYCSPGAVANFMEEAAQKCWYTAPQGRWRIVNHDFHYDVLVMDTQASSVAAADEILRRLVEVHAERFQEMLVYVEEEAAAGPRRVRRVRWTRKAPPEYLDFTR
jgi:hypothetical protein